MFGGCHDAVAAARREPVAMEQRTLTLRLRADGDTLSGTTTDESGAVRAFSGWLELIAALDSYLDQSRASEAEPHPSP